MAHYFKIGDFDTRSYGIHVTEVNVYSSAARSVETVDVPGRNGLLVLDNKKFDNVTIAYNCMIRLDEFCRTWQSGWTMSEVMWLFSRELAKYANAYYKLIDDYGKNAVSSNVPYYRMGRVAYGFEPTMGAGLKSATFTVTFDCKPQKFSIAGDTWVEQTMESSSTARFTIYDQSVGAQPLIHLRATTSSTSVTLECTDGSGALAIANPGTVHIFIDLETKNVYGGANMTTNLNPKTTLVGTFPQATSSGKEVYSTGISQARLKTRDFEI